MIQSFKTKNSYYCNLNLARVSPQAAQLLVILNLTPQSLEVAFRQDDMLNYSNLPRKETGKDKVSLLSVNWNSAANIESGSLLLYVVAEFDF